VERCFICSAVMDEAAYLTGQRFTVCEKCLVLATEEYDWEKNDTILEKIGLENLSSHGTFSGEELEWDVQHSLADMPDIREAHAELSPEIAQTLLRMFDSQGIPTLDS